MIFLYLLHCWFTDPLLLKLLCVSEMQLQVLLELSCGTKCGLTCGRVVDQGIGVMVLELLHHLHNFLCCNLTLQDGVWESCVTLVHSPFVYICCFVTICMGKFVNAWRMPKLHFRLHFVKVCTNLVELLAIYILQLALQTLVTWPFFTKEINR